MNKLKGIFSKLLVIGFVSSLVACTSTLADDQETSNLDNQEASMLDKMPAKISLESRDSGEMVTEFTEADSVSKVVEALDAREQTFLKLMPLFEYKLSFSNNGEQEVWHINKAGYAKKSDSADLFKFDASSVFETPVE